MTESVFESPERPPVRTCIASATDLFIRFLVSSASPHRDLPVCLGEACPAGTERVIFYNCEQLTREDSTSAAVIARAAARDVAEIWDYSRVNVGIWNERGYAARFVPLQTPDDYVRTLREFRAGQAIEWDVGFCGAVRGCPRRVFVLWGLAKAGLRVRVVQQRGEERDRELARCRVQINIHFGPRYRIWESHRCQAWLDVGVPVVSEHSLDDHPACINVPFERLVAETCRQVTLATAASAAPPPSCGQRPAFGSGPSSQ